MGEDDGIIDPVVLLKTSDAVVVLLYNGLLVAVGPLVAPGLLLDISEGDDVTKPAPLMLTSPDVLTPVVSIPEVGVVPPGADVVMPLPVEELLTEGGTLSGLESRYPTNCASLGL